MEDLLQPSALVQLRVNGRLHELDVLPSTSLLDLLRDQLGLTGTHMGCMTGHCGACTVMVDGRIVKSCITPVATLPRATVTTIEGLAGDDGTLSVIQQAFWDEAGLQCGFCAPGMILSAVELLDENADPSDDEIAQGIAGNLCRCTGYIKIYEAVELAAARMRGERAEPRREALYGA
jgi:carbon-monoxide dehydrogenase small subunit